MTETIVFYLGNEDAYNNQIDIINFGKMLSDNFDIHIISTKRTYQNNDFTKYYQVFGTTFQSTILGEIFALNKYMNENDPDILVSVTKPTAHGMIAGFFAKRNSTIFIQRYSSNSFDRYKYTNGLERIFYFGLNNIIGEIPRKFADEFIVLGPYAEQELIKRQIHPENITILPPAIDKERYLLNKDEHNVSLGFPNERSIVLFVGRLRRIKGIHVLERTIPKILNQRKDLQFLIIGEGKESLEIPKKYEDHVSIIGSVPPNLLRNYYGYADLLVLPSLKEAFGRVLVEALINDTRVIARDVEDVSTITSNTFSSEQEFIEMVVNFEQLSVDDPSPYTLDNLTDTYVNYFYRILG